MAWLAGKYIDEDAAMSKRWIFVMPLVLFALYLHYNIPDCVPDVVILNSPFGANLNDSFLES